MIDPPNNHASKTSDAAVGVKDFETYYFSQLQKLPICAGKINNRLGRLSDLVFHITEPYPEAVGIFIDHGWGKPTEFIPWTKVVKIDDDAIFVQPPEGDRYPPFVDQPGWLMINEHLMGQTILDTDGRRTEVVNDVHLLESRGRMVVVHVDVSFNGFWRRWRLPWLQLRKDRLISWKFVQPLSVEDTAKDTVSLSIPRRQMRNLPGEDLADILEELSGHEQQAFFSALDSEKAAEALVEAEPRAQRQLIGNLRRERARSVLSEMSAPQLAALFSVLPHDDKTEMMGLLPEDQAAKIRGILADREASAQALMASDAMTLTKETLVADALRTLRQTGRSYRDTSYIYILASSENLLVGVVDLRELVLASDTAALGDIMVAPVVSAEVSDTHDDLADLFTKYHYRMMPVVDVKDHFLGVVHYNDIMKGLAARPGA